MNFSHRPTKILLTGRSGTGKTTYFLAYLTRAPYRKKFVFDGEGEISHKLGKRPATSPQELLGALGGEWIVYDPAKMFPGDTAAGFRFFCDWSFHMGTRLPGPKLFAADELQKVTDQYGNCKELALILETGRRYEIDAILIAQQPNLIHNRTRNQLTEIVSFAQNDARAVQFLEDMGLAGPTIRNLRPGQFLAKNLQNGKEAAGKVF